MTRITQKTRAPARSRVLPLAEGELHVWITDLDLAHHGLDGRLSDRSPSDGLLADGLLSPQERVRARRFVRARDARRWEASRGLLRLLLGEYLGADPGALRFEASEHGKPRLVGSSGELRFNLSHSGAIAVYAVALGVEVGVDVETGRRGPHVLAVAERAFGRAAAVRLGRLGEAEREREFLRLWVRHEARLKCLGVGLGGGANGVGAQEAWTMDIEVEGGAVAAVAVAVAPRKIQSQHRHLVCPAGEKIMCMVSPWPIWTP